MALQVAEFTSGKTYTFQRLRHLLEHLGLAQEGIVDAGDFKVSQRAAGANMSVDVAAGSGFVKVDTGTRQGLAHVVNDGVANVTIAASHATLPRIDQVVLRYNDTTVPTGSGDTPTLEAVTGTATSGATLANLTGVTLGSDRLLLAFVLVPAAATTVTDANIGGYGDPRDTARGAVAAAPPQYALGRPRTYAPAVKARRDTGQSIANATSTAVAYDFEDYDNDVAHDTATNNTRLTCKTPGLYTVVAGVEHTAAAGAYHQAIYVRLNGAATPYVGGNAMSVPASGFLPVSTSVDLRLGYGDYLETLVYQNSGGSLFTKVDGNLKPFFAMQWRGP